MTWLRHFSPLIVVIFSVSAFGLGTMVYIGLEFGSWFEIPWDSPCYQVILVIFVILVLVILVILLPGDP